MVKTFVIDLDGTMYSGDRNIEGAREFINFLQNKKIPYIFLTNNATRTRKQIKNHMENLGFKNIKEEDFFTSAIASVKYVLKNYGIGKVFIVGEDGLREEILNNNFEETKDDDANFVFVGLDRKADYKKYSGALHNILNGAVFIATNDDKLLSNNNKFDVGNGGIVKMLEFSSGRESIKIGKPHSYILELLLEEFNLKKDEIILLGDNLETDIKLGYDLDVETLMVCSGVHKKEDIKKLKIFPTKVIDSLIDIID